MKLPFKAKAKDLYVSPLFRYNLRYAESLNPDKIFILSAKYGLVDLEEIIEPYDITLNDMSAKEVKDWSDKIIEQLELVSDLREDKFVFLAGNKYIKYLLSHIVNYEIPMKGLGIGKQLKYLKEKVSNE